MISSAQVACGYLRHLGRSARLRGRCSVTVLVSGDAGTVLSLVVMECIHILRKGDGHLAGRGQHTDKGLWITLKHYWLQNSRWIGNHSIYIVI